MRRFTTVYRGTRLRADLLNAMQDRAVGLVAADQNPAGAPAFVGADYRTATTPDAGLADGALCVLDASLDWRGRVLEGSMVRVDAAAQRWHGADAWMANDPARGRRVLRFGPHELGTGGVGAFVDVAPGTPPDLHAGSFALIADQGATLNARVWLYARPSDGALCLYNASGSALHADLVLLSYGFAPVPGAAPPPDLIPALTDVQWLTPGPASARPTNPGGPAIYRATDTGDITLYDGGAWRALGGGGGGPVTAASITDSGATGRALVQSPDSLAAWKALTGAAGFVFGASPTSAFASGDYVDIVTPLAAPAFGPGQSFACVLYPLSLPPGPGQVIACHGDVSAARGWQVRVGDNASARGELSLFFKGLNSDMVVQLPGADFTGSLNTPHALAVAITGPGVVRYSWDGGAVATVAALAGTYVAPAAADPLRVGQYSDATAVLGASQIGPLRWYSTVVTDADLVTASAQFAAYAVPTVTSGTVNLAIEPHALLPFSQRLDHGQTVRLVGACRPQAR